MAGHEISRGEIYWADLGGPAGRRPVVVLTRDAAIPVLSLVVCAPITRTIRSIRSEVLLGPDCGLGEECVVSCDSIATLPKNVLDDRPVGRLDTARLAQLDRALRYSLDILI